MNGAISKWMSCFKEGRETNEDDKHTGRRVTVTNDRKVAEIQEYILEDRRVAVENVAVQFGILYGTAHDIMLNKLGMCLVSTRWVPHLLLPDKLRVRVNTTSQINIRNII